MNNKKVLLCLTIIMFVLLVLLIYVAASLNQVDVLSDTIGTTLQTTDPTILPTVQTQPSLPPTSATIPQIPATDPAPPVTREPADEDFVRIQDYIPDIVVDLKYATEENFTGVIIYDFSQPWLRYGTVKKLIAVQEELSEKGLGLKIWDGFRPTSAQEKLWQICPDPMYVSKPGTGSQSHCRGIAVDVTLVDKNGKELPMPTGFDEFSDRADRDYADCTAEAAQNSQLLEALMEKNGFKPYFGEWWHYSDTVSYDIAVDFEP